MYWPRRIRPYNWRSKQRLRSSLHWILSRNLIDTPQPRFPPTSANCVNFRVIQNGHFEVRHTSHHCPMFRSDCVAFTAKIKVPHRCGSGRLHSRPTFPAEPRIGGVSGQQDSDRDVFGQPGDAPRRRAIPIPWRGGRPNRWRRRPAGAIARRRRWRCTATSRG